ncbi:Eco57I restriction-modification methylase domain-containing protein [Clostridium lundense]|uniref:Eco57I restriction-modification methylase domain-containing protein n=1 Tax=Clostridium lundense TaxID=319475 RepID=UPI000483575E|nr:N-6 DNA methylase [Clostridium lundense]
MYDFFVENIIELYNIILQPIDNIYKETAIINCKNIFNMECNLTFGEFYYNLLKNNKDTGVVYTPEEISKYIIENSVEAQDIINNPYIKIVDPACGCGNIIMPLFQYLYKLYRENLEEINRVNKILLHEKNIKEHIIKNNIYGIDIDKIATMILSIDLFQLSGIIYRKNILNMDFLTDKIGIKFNIFLGNPPYIGHKTIGKDYSKKIKEKYSEVYKDKGDLSYCFFKGAILNSEPNFKISFITSRYFVESQSGEGLRKFIVNNFNIVEIIDFYGIRPFKGTGIDPIILFLSDKNLYNIEKVKIIKPICTTKEGKKEFINSLFFNKSNFYNSFFIEGKNLGQKGWILREERELNILRKIEKRGSFKLKDICESYQGIITGCDKAFIVKDEEIVEEKLEKQVIKPWIKSSYIERDFVKSFDKFIIYSNEIKNIDDYPNIEKHLLPFKQKLMNRRECAKEIRKWYELQWGRKSDIFERKKIIFPYKSKDNRFALDKGSYFSADIYSMVIKENVNYSYDFLMFILNSKVYEFYFHSFGKKLGDDLYEYYPNTLMDLIIPKEFLTKNYDEKCLYEYFNFTEEEINIIKNK